MLKKMEAKRDIKGLIKALGYYKKDDSVKKRALEALVKIGGKDTVDKLLVALRDQDHIVRHLVANALGTIGDARAVNGLVDALKDQESFVRMEVASSLGKIRDARAADGLVVALKDQKEDVRRSAAWALGELMDARGVNGQVDALKDQNEGVRIAAAVALGKIDGARASVLLGLYDDLFNADNSSRVLAAQAICALEPGEEGLADLSRSLLENNEDINAHIRKTISKIKRFSSAAEKVVPQLLAAWKKEPISSDTFFIETLGKIGSPQAIDFMLQRLFEHPEDRLDNFHNSASAAFVLLIPVSSLTHEVVNCAVDISWQTSCYMGETEKLCNINSPVSSNILHLIATKKEIYQ